MKKIIFGSIIAIALFSACNNGENTTATTKTASTEAVPVARPAYTPPAGVDVNVSGSMKGIIDGYLTMKNALTNDDAKGAASAGNQILQALGGVNVTAMNEGQKKIFADLSDDIKENAEHISTNAGKIDHQREHFEMLSKDIEDLARTFGGGRTLYKDFCPMANDQKGASWVSEIKDIKNPYMGKEMPTCGEVKEELKYRLP